MPTPLKRPSLARILASLRPPSRAGPLPVQTGFPTSLADLVVKNHVHLRMPRKPQRRPSAVGSPVAEEESTEQIEGSGLSPAVQQQEVAVLRPPKDPVFFRFRPKLLALGGAVALALLAIWSKGIVAAFTVASLSLLGIESVRSASRRPETGEPLESCGRGTVSPIREVVEPETDTGVSSCGDSELGEVSSPIRTAEVGADGDDPTNPKRKGKRSLRKLFSRKLHKKSKTKDSSRPPRDGEVEQAVAGGNAWPAQTQTLLVPPTEQAMSESSAHSSSSFSSSVVVVVEEGRGGKVPLAAFVPVILAGLVAGKLPALALTVLCFVFHSAARRSPTS